MGKMGGTVLRCNQDRSLLIETEKEFDAPQSKRREVYYGRKREQK
jgi:hypothetical protein